MQLNLSTDYAIRAILYLSVVDRAADSIEMSGALAVPQRYLLNICAKLRRAGLLISAPGHGGGLRLAKSADEITLLDVITIMENSIRLNRCLEDDRYCSRNAVGHCPVHNVYAQAQSAMEAAFSVTFGELARRTPQ